MRRLVAIVVCALAGLPCALAQSNFWEPLPALYGGISTSENGTLYVLGSKLSRSTDQGTTWDTIPLPPAFEYLSLYADTQGTLFLGADNKFFSSANAGAAWTQLALPSGDIAYVSAFSIDGRGTYFMATRGGGGGGTGNGTLYASTDRGASWILVKNVSRWLKLGPGAGRFIAQMIKAPSGELFMGNNWGGGQSSHARTPWATFLGLPRAHTTAFGQSDDEELVAVSMGYFAGSGGTLYRSRDGGFRWKKVNKKPIGGGGLVTVVRAGGNYYAGTNYGAYVSTDNGVSWTEQNSGFPYPRIPVDRLVRSGGYLFAQSAGYIYRSTAPVPASAHPASARELEEYVPAAFALDQNFPNPFNPSTTIPFQLKDDALVTIRVYDALGRTVATLAENELFPAGGNEVFFDGSSISSGLYYTTMTAQIPGTLRTTFSGTMKMLLLR